MCFSRRTSVSESREKIAVRDKPQERGTERRAAPIDAFKADADRKPRTASPERAPAKEFEPAE